MERKDYEAKKNKEYIGVDVSKETLDIVLHSTGEIRSFTNDEASISALMANRLLKRRSQLKRLKVLYGDTWLAKGLWSMYCKICVG